MTTDNTITIEDVLKNELAELSKDRNMMHQVDDFLLSHHKFPFGLLQELSINNEKIDDLEEIHYLVIFSAIYAVNPNERIDPKLYFTDNKIKKAAKYAYQTTEDVLEYPLEYNKALSGNVDDYITKLTFQQIKQHLEHIWTYNFEAQRMPIEKIRKDGVIVQKPKLNKERVKEIRGLMLSGAYKPDSPIVINVMRDGEDEVYYNEDEFTLMIEKASQQNIIDGFHRVSAIISALEEEPNLEGYLWISIRNYTLEESKEYLGQHNSFGAFDKTHVQRLKSLGISDKITEDLDSKSDLKKRIDTKTSPRRKLGKITNFAVLSNAIKEIFQPESGKDRLEYSYVLTRFFDYLLGSYPDSFSPKNVEEKVKSSWICHHNTFVFYVAIAFGLYKKFGKDFPLDEITEIIDDIDFSRQNGHQFNDLITGGGSAQGKVNSNQTKRKIKEFGEKIIKDKYGI